MQSAAMGYALSSKHFADVLVAVPSSVSIVFMVGAGGPARKGGGQQACAGQCASQEGRGSERVLGSVAGAQGLPGQPCPGAPHPPPPLWSAWLFGAGLESLHSGPLSALRCCLALCLPAAPLSTLHGELDALAWLPAWAPLVGQR